MAILLILVPLGCGLLAIAIAAFLWAVRHDQFEDLELEGERILWDDAEPVPERVRPDDDRSRGGEAIVDREAPDAE